MKIGGSRSVPMITPPAFGVKFSDVSQWGKADENDTSGGRACYLLEARVFQAARWASVLY
jgi:hypothetical protein